MLFLKNRPVTISVESLSIQPSDIVSSSINITLYMQIKPEKPVRSNTSHEHLQWKTIDSQHLKPGIPNAMFY
jgi:hypothetical protein